MAIKNEINNAFTLIELIVGVTVSVLLMVSIGVFVSSGMKNIFIQQKLISNNANINDFNLYLTDANKNIDLSKDIFFTDDYITYKSILNYDKGGFTYIGKETIDKNYCDNDNSESTLTDHLFIKNFIPFIENGENINDSLEILKSKEIIYKGNKYHSVQKEHKIIDEKGKIIIGNGIFGNDFKEGGSAKDISLNSPTGIATDNEVIYLSDTLNDRILFYKDEKIYKLLDEDDGLKEPTGLYFDDENKALYIANSGKGEILKIVSKQKIVPNDYELSFSGVHEIDINKITLSFFLNNKSYSINSNIEIGDNSFYNNIGNKKIVVNNSIIYSFKKDILNSSGSIIGQEDNFISFDEKNEYTIKISNIEGFNEKGNYHIRLNIGNYNKDFYFFTQGDEKIYTMGDNSLEIVKSSLKYPNGIWGKDEYNEFDLFKTPKINFDKYNDLILTPPIESFNISNESGDLINIIYKVYKSYNCFNIDENKNSIETFVSKINLK